MKQKQYIFLLLFFVGFTLVSQSRKVENLPTFDDKKIHYGFYLGLNQNDFKLNLQNSNFPDATITVEANYGFNVGLIADLRLHNNLNLRFEPGLISNSKLIYFQHLSNERDRVREVNSTYLHVPLVLKFSTDRYKNIRPYVLGGISYDHNFSSNEANQDDNSAGQFRTTSSNFMYEVGFGIDVYLSFFKFSPSIRGVFALNNELVYDKDANSQWTSPINTLSTRGIFLNFAFE